MDSRRSRSVIVSELSLSLSNFDENKLKLIVTIAVASVETALIEDCILRGGMLMVSPLVSLQFSRLASMT
jgi:hypothetical protein